MLDAYPRTQLGFMLEQYGSAIITEPKRCRSILNDLAPQYRLETNLLIAVLEQKIAEQLLNLASLTPIELHLERLAQNLHDAIGIEQDMAYWAVESWALALKVIRSPVIKAILEARPEPKLLPAPSKLPQRHISLLVFFMVSIFIGVSLFAFFSNIKTKHEKRPVQQAVIELSKSGDTIKNPQIYLSQPEAQDAWTQNNLGDIYYYGYGVTKNYQTGVKWYQKAAEQGSALAQCNLGFMYANGYGVTKNYAKAVEWYRKAAEQRNADGQNSLGILYENGFGVAKDLQLAKEWYSRAVEQGHYGAQLKLKSLLEKQSLLTNSSNGQTLPNK
jgi:hypothetical protein